MLRITGGKVYDPAHNINGVIQDICIDNGKIVADVDGGRTINAAGEECACDCISATMTV